MSYVAILSEQITSNKQFLSLEASLHALLTSKKHMTGFFEMITLEGFAGVCH